MKHLATILPFKSKLSGKFQRFNAIDRTESILDIGIMGAFFVGTFSVKRKFLFAIFNESIFLKTQSTRLGAIVAPNKGLEQALQKYRNAEKWLNFQKFQLKRKIVKHFARPSELP